MGRPHPAQAAIIAGESKAMEAMMEEAAIEESVGEEAVVKTVSVREPGEPGREIPTRKMLTGKTAVAEMRPSVHGAEMRAASRARHSAGMRPRSASATAGHAAAHSAA